MAAIGRPCILKSAELGYDGKGQVRITAETDLEEAWAAMRGHAALFVNDILVTGAKQRSLARHFEALELARVDWLYLLDVAPELARTDAQIESRINRSLWTTLDELLPLLMRPDIRYTGKCVASVLGFESEALAAAVARLGASQARG